MISRISPNTDGLCGICLKDIDSVKCKVVCSHCGSDFCERDMKIFSKKSRLCPVCRLVFIPMDYNGDMKEVVQQDFIYKRLSHYGKILLVANEADTHALCYMRIDNLFYLLVKPVDSDHPKLCVDCKKISLAFLLSRRST